MAETVTMTGMDAVLAALKRADPVITGRVFDAVEVTTQALRYQASRRAPLLQTPDPRRTRGTLRDLLGYSFDRRTGIGRVGYPRGSKLGPTHDPFYAHMVEFGTTREPARPYMLPAAEAERPDFLDRVRRAGKDAERDLSVSSLT